MLAAFLFIIYLWLGCFFVTRIPLVKQSGLGMRMIIALFIARIAAGCMLGLMNYYLLHSNTDYDVYNSLGYLEYQTLFSDPHKFFTDIFVSNYDGLGEFFGSSGSYWNDLRTNIMFKLIGIVDIFSRGNYFINSIFFNFFAFIANVALYRVFIHVFPAKKTAVIIGCFLLPSTLYFSSGIHKDLFVFAGLCFFCYYMYFSPEEKFTSKRLIGILLSFLLIFFIRNFIAVLLIPCVAAWWFSKKYTQGKRIKPIYIFGAALFLCAVGIISIHYLIPQHDPLKIIAGRQHDFMELSGGSLYAHIDTLQPTIGSLIKATPTALRHAFLSPLPGEFSQPFSNLFSAEIIFYWLIILFSLCYSDKQPVFSHHFVLFGLMFVLLVFLFTGYISTAEGALIRYRSIYFPLIMIPFLCNMRWPNKHIKI